MTKNKDRIIRINQKIPEGDSLRSLYASSNYTITNRLFVEQNMTIISELLGDAKFIIRHRKRIMPIQKELDRQAPKIGDLAPDFTLTDSSGTEIVTLSQFRGVKPVALAFGSYT